MIQFVIPGDAQAQQRPKFSTFGGHAKAYDPEKSRNYKAYVRMIAAKYAPEKPLEGQIKISLKFYRPIPKSFSKKKTVLALCGEIQPVTKPDLDNMIKGVKDAFKGLIWHDDNQVVLMQSGKYYSDTPRVEVIVSEIKEEKNDVYREIPGSNC